MFFSLTRSKPDSRKNKKHSNRRRISRIESLEARQLLAAEIVSPMHNTHLPADVNLDGKVTALDALNVINLLQRSSSGKKSSSELVYSGDSLRPDTNNDTKVTALDALVVINSLNQVASAPVAFTSLGDALPEAEADPSLFLVINSNDSGPGSLRQAILNANAATEPVTISFAIPATDGGFVDVDSVISGGDVGPDVFRITPLTALPLINNVGGHAVSILGETQHDETGDTNPFGPEIELVGSALTGFAQGLDIVSKDVTVRDLVINQFPGVGIWIRGDNALISGNYIGTDPTGSLDRGNTDVGIIAQGANNIAIGGALAAEGNVISGNRRGITLEQTDGAKILNNFIGVDVSGTFAIPNGEDFHDSKGINVNTSTNLVIGAAGAGNVISGTVGSFGGGIAISTCDTVVIAANKIGTNADGTAAIGNVYAGVTIVSSDNITIGGSSPGEGNLISGNLSDGVFLELTNNVSLFGNTIGAAINGETAIPNRGQGISSHSSWGLTFGGPSASQRNVISGNGNAGISLFGWAHNANVNRDVTIENNYFGVGEDGNGEISNGGTGIQIHRTADARIINNVVGNSGISGIEIYGRDDDPTLVQWPVSEGGNDHFYMIAPPLSWSDAEAFAATLGGHVASITSEQESNFIASTFRATGHVHRDDHLWIGLTDAATEGTYVWADSDVLNYTNWSTNEPFGDQFHNYVTLQPDGTWFVRQEWQHSFALLEFSTLPSATQIAAALPPTGFELLGNKIGVSADGSTAAPNKVGIFVSNAKQVVVGGIAEGQANTIAFNTQAGIDIRSNANVTLTGNSIHSNALLGIDLSPSGTTANDPGDTDTGANGLQNYPVLSATTTAGIESLVGTLNSLPNATFTVEVFLSDAATAAEAEGETLLLSTRVTTDSEGIATFVIPRQPAGTTGFLTATATDSLGNTSEFSNAIAPLIHGPELRLMDGTNVIVDGAAVSLGATSLGTPRVKTLTVQNAGTQDLILQPIVAPAGFSLVSNFTVNQSVAPGASAEFVVQFDAAAEGTLLEALTIPNNEVAFSVTLGGTAVTGLRLVKDIHPGLADANVNRFIEYRGEMYFLADDGIHGQELWKTDGTTAGTMMVKDIDPGPGSIFPTSIYVANDLLIFDAHSDATDSDIWRSDGTEAGTQVIFDMGPDGVAFSFSGSNPNLRQSGATKVYFAGDDGSGTGYELWSTDGTAEGTQLVKDIAPGADDSDPASFYTLNGITYFKAEGASNAEFWRTDGTESGTYRVIDPIAGVGTGSSAVFAIPLTAVNGMLFAPLRDGASGNEPWTSDGTESGTTLVADIRPGSLSSNPFFLGAIGNQLLFRANNGANGEELWVTDGTTAGTRLIKDVNPGSASGLFTSVAQTFGSSMYFFADNGLTGRELWITDGTEVGTTLLFDLNPGTAGSVTDVRGMSRLGNKLFFGGNDGTTGVELWVYEPFGPDALEILVDTSTIAEDGSAMATVTRSGLTDSELSVSISSDDDTELSIPASVVIPVGSSSTTFTIGGVNDGVVDGDQSVSISVSAAGFASADAAVLVTDIDAADTTKPTSRVNPLPDRATSKSFMVSVTGSDPASANEDELVSGVASYEIYVADGSGPFQPWVTLPVGAAAPTFTGQSNRTYHFRSIARDVAGNVETKPITIEAHTYIPDLDAPVSSVVSVDSDAPNFVIELQAVEIGGSLVSEFRVYVEVDGVPAITPFAIVSAAAPDSGGLVRATVNYQAIADGAFHDYRFYTVTVDSRGNVESAPATGDVTVSKMFSEPANLAVTSLDVQNGAAQRSYIRNLDIQFNTDAELQALLDTLTDGDEVNNRLQLKRFANDGIGVGVNVSLTGKVVRDGSKLSIDLGAGGIGGDARSNVGNGYYRLLIDEDGDGGMDNELDFYRLYGDVNGDRIVDTLDVTDISRALSKRSRDANFDINGDGVVNSLDRVFAQKETRLPIGSRSIDLGLHLDD